MHNTRRRKNTVYIDSSRRNKTKMQNGLRISPKNSCTSITLGTSYDNNTEINELKATIAKNTHKNNSKKKVVIKDDGSKSDSFASAVSGTVTVNQETSTIASDNDLPSNFSFANNEKPVGVALERKPLKYFRLKESQDVHNNKTEWHVRQRRVKVKNKAVAAFDPTSINTCNASTATKSKPVKDLPNISDDSDSVKDIDERISTHSTDVMCRICHGGEVLSTELGELISACSCRGSVGRVHVRCLERWLTESCKSRCELCGTRYSTRRVHKYGVPKALVMWILSQNAKQLMVDSLGIMLMSPLAVLAAWLSGRTLAGLMMQEPQVTPWPLASTFVLACMTLVCYYCWIVSAATRHALGWWVWYRSQYEVRLQFALAD